MGRCYVIYDRVVGDYGRMPRRYKRLSEAKMALRVVRDKHPMSGERYTLARLVDIYGIGKWEVDKVYEW